MLRSLLWFRRDYSLRPLDPSGMSYLHSREWMHALVYRQRAHADRTGRPFALVTFRIPQWAASRRNLLRLARTARARARVTDDVGWFDNRTLAVLLPETEVHGARRYAEGVIGVLQERNVTILPETKVFSYPSDWYQDGRRQEHASAGEQRRTAQVYAPAFTSVEPARVIVEPMEPLFVRPIPLGKRLADIIIASAMLILCLPVLMATGLAVALTSPGPVVFRQRRSGLGGKPFTMYKFRSMYLDAEARLEALRKQSEVDGPVFKMKQDPRITPVGRWIRRTSIDELPQLINVLKGDMSLVGPRPPIISETEQYEKWQYRRLEITPGLTCIWQVSGRSGVRFEQWMRMDTQYAAQRSLLTDLRILLQTIPAVLMGRGAC